MRRTSDGVRLRAGAGTEQHILFLFCIGSDRPDCCGTSSADLIDLFRDLFRLCRNDQDQFTGSHAIHDLIDHDRCHKCRDQTIENCVHISKYRPSKQNDQKIDRHGYKSD